MITLEEAEKKLAQIDLLPFSIPLLSWTPIIKAIFKTMPKRTWIFSGARARIGAVYRGVSVGRLADPKAGAKPYKIAPNSNHSARRALQAVGSALHTQQPTLCILADAALAQGEFYQALELSSRYQAPVIFVLIRYPIDQPGSPLVSQSTLSIQDLCTQNNIAYIHSQAEEHTIRAHVQHACQSLKPILIETKLEK